MFPVFQRMNSIWWRQAIPVSDFLASVPQCWINRATIRFLSSCRPLILNCFCYCLAKPLCWRWLTRLTTQSTQCHSTNAPTKYAAMGLACPPWLHWILQPAWQTLERTTGRQPKESPLVSWRHLPRWIPRGFEAASSEWLVTETKPAYWPPSLQPEHLRRVELCCSTAIESVMMPSLA